MSITNVEFLEDRVKVHYNLGKPYGILDVHDAIIDVSYSDVDKLREPPLKIGAGQTSCEFGREIFIPNCGKTIMFVFDSYQEMCGGPNEEDIYGPYLKTDQMKFEEFLKLDFTQKYGVGIRALYREDVAWEKLSEEQKREIGRPEKLKILKNAHKIRGLLGKSTSISSLGKLLEEPCEECGQNKVYCGSDDFSQVDHNYVWWHLCLNCLDTKYLSCVGCGGYEDYEDDTFWCPFCKSVTKDLGIQDE